MSAPEPPQSGGTSSHAHTAGTRNPAFRMIGLPNLKLKLPSRNWMIFLSLSGTLASAIIYDKHEKTKAQQKWCQLVSHLAQEPLDPHLMPRRVTIYLSAPPGDTLKASRDYFNDYVKPVLVAGALDWDLVEGRREGEVRAGLAERIRRLRRRHGEQAAIEIEPQSEDLLQEVRSKSAIQESPGIKGDLVVGRHTWKEYIRGLHEGWLGPLDAPQDLSNEDTTASENDGEGQEKEQKKEEKPKKPPVPMAYIPASQSEYSASMIPSTFAKVSEPIQPSTPIVHPHVLGFLNTPTRFWRFLHRRELADSIGRETAALVLGSNSRPYEDSFATADDRGHEVASVLSHEESSWHKSIRRTAATSESSATEANSSLKALRDERVWLDDVVLDSRIASRMRKFELDPSEVAQANSDEQ